MRGLVLSAIATAVLLAGACGGPSTEQGGEAEPSGIPRAASAARRGAPPLVVGTTLEAATGRALAGVQIEGPGGAQAHSDAEGRFEIKGLARGISGRLRAVSPDGLSGEVLLRPLAGGRLEVVIHLR